MGSAPARPSLPTGCKDLGWADPALSSQRRDSRDNRGLLRRRAEQSPQIIHLTQVCAVPLRAPTGAGGWGPAALLPRLLRSEVSERSHTPGQGWLSSGMPLREEEGTVAALDLSAHPCAHRGGGQRSLKSCSVSVGDGDDESLLWVC